MSTVNVGEPTVAGAAWRYRWLVLAALIAFLAAGAAYAETRPAAYSATGSMTLQDPHSVSVFATGGGQAPDRYVGDQITLLKSPQLAAAAAAAGAAETPPISLSADDFSRHTQVTGTPSSGSVVDITFTSTDSASALGGLDAIRIAYERIVHDGVNAQLSALLNQIDNELSSINLQLSNPSTTTPQSPGQQAALVARRDTLTAKRDQIVVDASSGSNGVALYLPPTFTTHTSKLIAALPIISVAGVVGLLLGVALAYVLASRRRAFRGRDEPEAVLNVALIAEVPAFHRSQPLPAADEDRSPGAAAAFRAAALVIAARQSSAARDTNKRRPRTGPRRIAVVSAVRRQGRSTVAANLAIALSDSGLSTLVIDADPATGGVSTLLRARFELAPAGGPADQPAEPAEFVLSAAAGAAAEFRWWDQLESIVRHGHSLVRLGLLRVGDAPHPVDSADRDRQLQSIEEGFDVVIIDTPPITDVGPLWPVIRRADGALVVVNAQTAVAELDEEARLMKAVDLTPLGYIYNHRPRLRRVAASHPRPAPAPPAAPHVARPPDPAPPVAG